MGPTKHRARIEKVRTQQRRRRVRRVLHLSILGAIVGRLPPARALPPDAAAVTYGRIATSFEANRGQTDPRVEFLTRGKGVSVFFTPAEVVLALRPRHPGELLGGAALFLRFAGANPRPPLVGEDELPGKSNYFIGNDPGRWHTEVPTYARLRYGEVYPGVDLVFYGTQEQLEYDLIISPGADPASIVLAFDGATRLAIAADGDLVLHTAAGDIRQRKPRVYQELDGVRQAIDGRYVVKGRHRVGFEVARYDRRRPLVIDPTLVYSRLVGGTGDDESYGVVVDGTGAAYMAGFTTSSNFPVTAGGFDRSFGGVADVFVAKLNAAGTSLVYSTFIGGSNDDEAFSIAVDANGAAYVTGYTASSNFPVSSGAVQGTLRGGLDAFILKLSAAGSALLYSTYLGGTAGDVGQGIAIDTAGAAYVTGYTASSNFPHTAGVVQGTYRGGVDDAFVTKVNATGTAFVYSTFLGGVDYDEGVGIAVDQNGAAYVAGQTACPVGGSCVPGVSDFPRVPSTQPPYGGGTFEGFVAKLNTTGTAFAYSRFLGGTGGSDAALAIAVDGNGAAYVTGQTDSPNFPTTLGAFQTTPGGGGIEASPTDAFVTKLNAAGTGPVYSTFLGGNDYDFGYGIRLDSSLNAYVTGGTSSTNFPTSGAIQGSSAGGLDVFVSKLNSVGQKLLFGTYLGGSRDDEAYGITVAGSAIYVTGFTTSSNFRNTGAVPFAGVADAFVAKISTGGGCQ